MNLCKSANCFRDLSAGFHAATKHPDMVGEAAAPVKIFCLSCQACELHMMENARHIDSVLVVPDV